MGPPLTDDQQSVYLKEALSVVQIQSRLMRQCLVSQLEIKKGTRKRDLTILWR